MIRKLRWNVVVLIVIGVGLTLFIMKPFHRNSLPTQTVTMTVPTQTTAHSTPKEPSLVWKKITIQPGDSLARIFSRLHIRSTDLVDILKQQKTLTLLHPGDIIELQVDPQHRLQKIKYSLNSTQIALLERQDSHFVKKTILKPITTTLAFKSVTIHHTLYRDAQQSGLTYTMIQQLKNIFEGSVNFSRDIHPGDHFSLLYEELYVAGKKIKNGNIMAASFTCLNKIHQAIRYTYPIAHTGYYTPDGQAVESRFLRNPLQYKRISSHFNRHRFDPVVHKTRPHLGTDFAAYRGTPIKSVGDGKIIFIGKDGGYGKTIKIRYGKHYKALYGHMWRFAKNITLHSDVRKGQTIGYVGETGWATGPHLHFGFYVNGKARDWLTMPLPADKSIPHNYYTHFLASSKRLLAQLKLYQQTKLASND